MTKKKQIWLLASGLAILLGIWIAGCSAIGVIAAEMALHPGRHVLGTGAEARAQAIASRNHASLAVVAAAAEDGATLRGWILRPVSPNGDAVILLHGHTDNRTGMLGTADLLLRHGYVVLIPDARAHGESGGDLATYGVKEAGDVRNWFEWLRRSEMPRCVDGLGESMGAAQLLQSLSVEREFCAVVAESPYASFREASYDRLGEKVHAGAGIGRTLLRPAVEAGFIYARWRYGVDLDEASPEKAVGASRVPVLLIHGLRDTNLPPRHSEMIVTHNARRTPSVDLWEPAEAGHCGAAGAEPVEFERRVIAWFEGHRVAATQP